jgi:hypothetical protein
MIYLLKFLGFLLVAVLIAASPLLLRTIEYMLPRRVKYGRNGRGNQSLQPGSEERSEIRTEIHRMTAILEADRPAVRGDSHP